MIAPAVLACFPTYLVGDGHIAFLATAGALSFYTFLLLPAALRFDFRRDLDRLATLQGLPISAAATTFGQLLANVLIATLFQCTVLAFAAVARDVPPELLLVTITILLPTNAFIFALENLVYLLYPYRLQQEGLEIFLRTMLTFTGKGLLFAVGLAAMSLWGFGAAALTRGLASSTGLALNAFAVFTVGMIAGTSMLAAAVVSTLCRTYDRLDPIEDLPR
jgi:hypothetical protein